MEMNLDNEHQANPDSGADQGGLSIGDAASAIEGLLYGGNDRKASRRPQQASADEDRQDTDTGDENADDEDLAEDEDGEDADSETDDDESDDAEDGDEDSEDEDDEESDESDPKDPKKGKQPTFTVKVDDKDETVTLDELLKGYQREANYRRKTMKHADEVRAFNEGRQQRENERKYFAQTVQDYLKALESNKGPSDEELATLASTDPAGYIEAMERRRQYDAAKSRAESDLQLARSAHAKESTQHAQEQLAKASEKLLELIPEWKDAKKAKAGKAAVAAYLREQGIADEAIARISDPVAVSVAHKARLYDALMAKKAEADKRVRKAPKMAEPKAAAPGRRPDNSERAAAARKTLKRSGRVEDAAAAIALRLR